MTTFCHRLFELIKKEQELRVGQSNLFLRYEVGLRQLKYQMGANHPNNLDALSFEQRLLENIDQWRQHGDTETRRSERSQIIDELNKLALSAIGLSFNELCSLGTSDVQIEQIEYSPGIFSSAEDVLQFPLCLIQIPQSNRLMAQCLERIRSKLESGDTEGAVEELKHVGKLESSGEIHYLSLTRLFRAGVYEKQGDYQNAREWVERAYRSSGKDHLYQTVVLLISGNNYVNNSERRGKSTVAATDAFNEAVGKFEELEEAEAEQGNRLKAEFYRVLKESLQQHIIEIQTEQKVIRFPILDDNIMAGPEKVTSDCVIGHIRQIDELGLEFKCEGQALQAKLLKGSRFTWLPEYDYFAVRVSGDSMNRADICPNDYVVLRKPKYVERPVPDNGDIVAVVFSDEADNKATLKRFYVDKPSGRVIFRPESSNPDHKPRPLSPKVLLTNDSPVVGIAIAVLKPRPQSTL